MRAIWPGCLNKHEPNPSHSASHPKHETASLCQLSKKLGKTCSLHVHSESAWLYLYIRYFIIPEMDYWVCQFELSKRLEGMAGPIGNCKQRSNLTRHLALTASQLDNRHPLAKILNNLGATVKITLFYPGQNIIIVIFCFSISQKVRCPELSLIKLLYFIALLVV